MNIPLDNLYHWIDRLVQHPVMLYVFRPHGSKDIFNLHKFKNYDQIDHALLPVMICHDQEPLDFADRVFDHDMDRLSSLIRHRACSRAPSVVDEYIKESEFVLKESKSIYRNHQLTWLNIHLMNEWVILLHSEINSKDVDQFSKVGFCPVYYWSHAMIARDWYRFAQYDSRLKTQNLKKTFLVYCRDWMPNREYRLKFLDLATQQHLTTDCIISTQHVNNQGVHLKDYQVENPQYAFDADAILNTVPNNTVSSSSSSDYDVDDITSTKVSVVLETVFDSGKIHLTEKILRPIACAHPFVLAAGPGALQYLRSYGFKTFSKFWNESYDDETDASLRLEKIIGAMKQIQNLSQDDWREIKCIADHNQQHFFSEEFINQVTTELTHNLKQAVDFCIENCGENYWRYRKLIRRTGFIKQLGYKSEYCYSSIKKLRQHRLLRSRDGPSPVVGQ